MKLAIITNIPAPYRIPIFNRIAAELGEDFLVVYCARLEPDRQWDLARLEFNHVFLRENFHTSKKGAFIHCNPGVLRVLREFRPDVVVTTGFNPTHLLSWAYTLCTGSRHVPMTDGWIHSESALSRLHRVVRSIVYRTSSAFIGAGKNSHALFKSYGIKESRLFQSHLCIDNERFSGKAKDSRRQYDIMYSGQIREGKIPGFFSLVAQRAAASLGSLSVLIIGDGPCREELLDSLKKIGVQVDYAGFVSQARLPDYYCTAKLLLFTTKNDAWGIVANEALASGTPVITSPYAGVANDLVLSGVNGHILELDASLWAEKIVELLTDDELLERMRLEAIESVKPFNFQNAANGILAAAWHARAGKIRFMRSDPA